MAIPNKGFGAGRLSSTVQNPRQIFDLAFWIDFLRTNQKFGYLRAENFVLLNPLLGIAWTLALIRFTENCVQFLNIRTNGSMKINLNHK